MNIRCLEKHDEDESTLGCPVVVVTCALGFSSLANARDRNRHRSDRESNPSYQDSSSQDHNRQSSQSNRRDQTQSNAADDGNMQGRESSNHRYSSDQQPSSNREISQYRDSDSGRSSNQDASLGVTLDPNSQGHGQGVRIMSVYRNSPAAQAGLKSGDRIVKVDGRTVSNAQEVVQRIRQMAPNQSTELTVIADGATEELNVRLGSRAETLQGATIRRGDTESYRDQSDSRYGSSSWSNRQSANNNWSDGSGPSSNESLAQVLASIRQELQQIRQQLSQLKHGSSNRNFDRSNEISYDRDRSTNSPQYRDSEQGQRYNNTGDDR